MSSFDFTLRNAFHTIDESHRGKISISALDTFMRRCEYTLSDQELDAAMRVIDTNEDFSIDLAEFADAVLPYQQQQPLRSPSRHDFAR